MASGDAIPKGVAAEGGPGSGTAVGVTGGTGAADGEQTGGVSSGHTASVQGWGAAVKRGRRAPLLSSVRASCSTRPLYTRRWCSVSMSQDSESSAFRSRIAKEPSTSSSHRKPAEVLLWAQRRGGRVRRLAPNPIPLYSRGAG
eukprot:scaffold85229_cov63-Phaeocystis_antarctica.AAC.4